MGVDREMGGDPIENDAQPRQVGAVNEARKSLRRAEASGGRKQADRLIPHEMSRGCSVTGNSSRCVNPKSTT